MQKVMCVVAYRLVFEKTYCFVTDRTESAEVFFPDKDVTIEYPGYPATKLKAALHSVTHTYKCSCVRSHILANVRTYGYIVKETESVAIRSSVILYDKIDAHVRMSRS